MRQSRQQETLAGICEREHFVQFYERDDIFLSNLKNFVGAALKDGTPCVAFATSSHLLALRVMLRDKGLGSSQTNQSAKFLALDASDALTRIMIAGRPDRKLLRNLFAELIDTLGVGDTSFRCFGEMVALLCKDGNTSGAMALEQMWNQLARDYSFTLFCAYPVTKLAGSAPEQLQREISSLHSCTIAPRTQAEAYA
jgi:hypothetical protein